MHYLRKIRSDLPAFKGNTGIYKTVHVLVRKLSYPTTTKIYKYK
jgi:hypothetical protein